MSSRILFSVTFLLLVIIVACQSPTDVRSPDDTRSQMSAFVVGGSVCGDGIIEGDEQCDDGNTTDGDGCSTFCLVEENCYDVGNTFAFVIWSDSYGGAGEGGVRRFFNDVVNQATYPDRVIPRMWFAAGDVPYVPPQNVSLESLNAEISGANYPFACSASDQNFPMYVALGNHDVDGANPADIARKMEYWSNVIGPQAEHTLVGIRNFQWGPDNDYDARTTYSFDYKNTHFVVYNQYFDAPYPSGNPLGCVRPTLYDWIDQDLAATTQPIKVVIGHEPAWSYCSEVQGNNACVNFGNDFDEDMLVPGRRPRPYSPSGIAWFEGFGRHWGDSLEDYRCPLIAGQESRAVFWQMLAEHEVVAHFVGHTHTYSSRLVDADGPRNDPDMTQAERNRMAYGKVDDVFAVDAGVWEIDSAQTHTWAGAAYVLVTVRDDVVTFETWDQMFHDDDEEPYNLVERWHVYVGDSPPDFEPPTVAMTSPPDESIVGGSVTVSADATDNIGVTTVQFLLDGSNLGGGDTTAPFTTDFDTTAVSDGIYQLSAIAQDVAGNEAMATAITVTVDNMPPTIVMTTPPDQATVGGIVLISADANDINGVAGVQFLLNGAILGDEDTIAPYTIELDTTTLPDGTHTLSAVAHDAVGNTTTATAITIIVDNIPDSFDIFLPLIWRDD